MTLHVQDPSSNIPMPVEGRRKSAKVYALMRNGVRYSALALHNPPGGIAGIYVQEAGTSPWQITFIDSSLGPQSFTPVDNTFYPFHLASVNLTGVTGSPVFFGDID